MNTINRAVFSSIVITSSLARGVLSDDFIIGKEEDEKILVLSIVFLAICAAFLLISILFPILLLRKLSSLRRGAEYVIEMREERHQSMYTSNGRIDQQEPSHFEIFKLSDSNGATYLSPPYEITISPSNGPQNDQNETLQRKVATKEKQNLGAFENHAYQSGSMASGLENTSDAAVENDLNRPALK